MRAKALTRIITLEKRLTPRLVWPEYRMMYATDEEYEVWWHGNNPRRPLQPIASFENLYVGSLGREI